MQWTHVKGTDKGQVNLYALSTCGWCAKTKQLLNDLKIDFQYVYVDLLPPEELRGALQEVAKWNPQQSFPTLVIDNEKVIVGFRE
ncbi:MAG TPA: glutaredoxin family protein, partial [Methanomicrobiales archaeon]|nr:glutaredoxin family protein [Methanomicrobiales archaeon]